MSTEQTRAEQVDALVIGSGQAGVPLSRALANSARHTVLVESAQVGGTCINVGCTPTKTMVASARVADVARRAADYGVRLPPGAIEIDLGQVHARKEAVVHNFRGSNEQSIESTTGLDLLRGSARFVAPYTVEVDVNAGGSRRLQAPLIFINAGLRPSVPTLPGLERVNPLDSTSIMELEHVPDHLVVLGGGYVGLEFGQMFRRFGSRVSIVQRGPKLLNREDDDIADAVAQILRDDGIDVLLDTAALGVDGDAVRVDLRVRARDGSERTLTGSHLLLATGRTSNADRLNLGAAGVHVDAHGFVPTDNRLRTNVPDVYALGDIRGGPAFTHISYDDFRIIRSNVIEGGDVSIDNRLVPYTVFIDPQLGRVGLTEREALAQGRKIKVARMPMTSVARAIEVGETRGVMKAVIDEDSSQILGCAMLGIEGGEVMAVVQVAMMGHLPYTSLKEGVFAHPTLAESLNNLFLTLDG